MLYTVNQTLQSKCFFNPRPRPESSSKRKINQNLRVKQKTLFTHLAGHFDWTFVHNPLDAFITRGRGQRSWVGVEPLIIRKDIRRGYPTFYDRVTVVSRLFLTYLFDEVIRRFFPTVLAYNYIHVVYAYVSIFSLFYK